MLAQAIDVLGPDRVMFGQDDPYGGSAGRTGADSRGRFSGHNGARAFVETAPISAQDKAKLAHLNAERLDTRQRGLKHAALGHQPGNQQRAPPRRGDSLSEARRLESIEIAAAHDDLGFADNHLELSEQRLGRVGVCAVGHH